ncbi:MAG TPA: SRPBCC domain-containing protein [Rhizomicrobium sp.]|nr:SRPBCC domain-containing protein [Rhizomicrobium sp.]
MTVDDKALLIIRRVFDAAPARIFDAWMEREQFEQWIGPEGVRCEVPVYEPRVGGRYRIIMHLSDGRIIPVVGAFKSIDRPRGFSMSWKWESGEEDSLVTVSLRDVGGKTELTLRHDGLQTAENRDGHETGWNSALNKLGRFVVRAG